MKVSETCPTRYRRPAQLGAGDLLNSTPETCPSLSLRLAISLDLRLEQVSGIELGKSSGQVFAHFISYSIELVFNKLGNFISSNSLCATATTTSNSSLGISTKTFHPKFLKIRSLSSFSFSLL